MNYRIVSIILFCFILTFSINCKEKNNFFSKYDEIIYSIKDKDVKKFNRLLNDYDINARDKDGKTLLFYTNNIEMTKILLNKKININLKDNEGSTALFYTKDIEIAKILLNKKIDINSQDKKGYTALATTIKNGKDEVTKILIEKGANIKLNPDDKSLFLLACIYSDLDVIKLLVEKGANYNVVDKDGNTGLMLSNGRSLDVAEYLIKIGIDINAKDKKGDTALMQNTYSDLQHNYVDLLIKKGADVNIINTKENKTALDKALESENSEAVYNNDNIIDLLKKAGAKQAKDLK